MGSRGEREEERETGNIMGAGLLVLDLKIKEEGSAFSGETLEPGGRKAAFLDFSPERPRADLQPIDQ